MMTMKHLVGGKDESYHRILFVPGRAVQARELTQLQFNSTRTSKSLW